MFENIKYCKVKTVNIFAMNMLVTLELMGRFSINPVNSRWSKPPKGYSKLNIYGRFCDGQGSFGGVFQNEDGD